MSGPCFKNYLTTNHNSYILILSMAVGTGGQGGQLPPPPIFCQPKKFKIVKTTTYRSVYRNMAKIC